MTKDPRQLSRDSSQAARGETTVSGIPRRLNCCLIFTAHTEFTSVAAGDIIQPGGQRVGD
jgi:hypothetical protein